MSRCLSLGPLVFIDILFHSSLRCSYQPGVPERHTCDGKSNQQCDQPDEQKQNIGVQKRPFLLSERYHGLITIKIMYSQGGSQTCVETTSNGQIY
jgi:hypothetical protein